MRVELKILEHGKEFYSWKHSKPGNALGLDPYYSINESLLPAYATPGSAAMDLRLLEDLTLYPGESKLIGTGLAIHIGCAESLGLDRQHWSIAALFLPRSGIGHRLGCVLGNGTGLIDEDYQGELKVSVWNRKKGEQIPTSVEDGYQCYEWDHPENIIKLKAGERFVQMMFIPVIKAQWTIVDELSNRTERGEGGYGSTGIE
jgi:dUTP pyrophosphatase